MVYVLIFIIELAILFLFSKRLHNGFGRLFFKITGSSKWTTYLLAVLFLPGTLVHEVAHFLTALFLLVPVGQFELMPEIIEEKRIKLGSVPIGATDPIRRFLIGSAPLIVGNVIIFVIVYYLTSNRLANYWWQITLLVYLIFCVANTMYLSKKDLEGAWKVLILMLIILAVLYVIGFRFQMVAFQSLFSDTITEVVKNSAKYLSIPILIDFAFIILFKSFRLI